MFDRPDRLQLVSLTYEEITALVRAVPGLAASWAKSADIDIEWFEAGKPAWRLDQRTWQK